MSAFRRKRKVKQPDGSFVTVVDETWSFKFNHQGKSVVRRGFQTKGEAAGAEIRAREAARKGHIDIVKNWRMRAAPSQVATIPELCESYLSALLENSTNTRKDNVQALHLLLRKVGKDPAAENPPLSTAVLTPQLIRDYFRAVVADCGGLSQDEANSRKRTANGLLVKVMSLFTAPARSWYRDQGLELPDLDALSKSVDESNFKRVPRKTFNPPPDSVIEKTLAAWPQLQDRNMFIAAGLALCFGLRIGESAQVKKSWFTTVEGRPTLYSGGDFKNGAGIIQTCALDPFWTTFNTRCTSMGWWGTEPDDYLLQGNETERTSESFRRVSEWMRDLGWTMKKTNHALRDYSGSQLAMKYSLWEASIWLRHSSVQVTQDYYTSFVNQHRMIDKDKLPVRWAAAQQQFVPTIVRATA